MGYRIFTRRIAVIGYLFILALVIPAVYYIRFGAESILPSGLSMHMGSLANDNYTHARMIYEMYQNISNFGWPKLYVNNIDPSTNFPFFQFYNFGPYLISSALFIFRQTNIYQTYIFAYTIPLFLGSIGIFLIARDYTKSLLQRMLAPALFILSPYMVVDILVRNAFSEVWAFCLLPLLFWSLRRLLLNKSNSWELLIWFPVMLIFLTSHNITILYSLLFASIYIASFLPKEWKNRRWWMQLGLLFGVPFLICTPYLAPAFLHTKSLLISNFLDNPNKSIYLSKLSILLSTAPFSGNQASPDRLPLQIGIPFLYVIFLITKSRKYIQLVSIILLLLVISLPIWNYIPTFFHAIQFSYRLLVFVVLLVSIYFCQLKIDTKTIFILGVMIFISSFTYLNDTFYYTPGSYSYTASYMNSYYYYRATEKSFVPAQLHKFQEKSTKIESRSEITVEPNNSVLVSTIDCKKQDCKGTLWVHAQVNNQFEKEHGTLRFNILKPVEADNLLYQSNILEQDSLLSYCMTGTEDTIQVLVVNTGLEKVSIPEVTVYSSPKQIRPVVVNKTILPSTCDLTKTADTLEATFASTYMKMDVVIPYFYSNENWLTQDNKIVKGVPVLTNENASYIVVKNNSTNPIIVHDGIFPFSLISN